MANLGADEDEESDVVDDAYEQRYGTLGRESVRERAPRRGAKQPTKRRKQSDSLNPFLRAQNTLARAASRITDDHKRLFSEDEAGERKQDIADMLQRWSDNLDEFLTISATHVNKEEPCEIWALEDDEAQALAGSWLKRAKRNEQAAALLRLSLEGDDDLQSLIVLGPRLWKTASWYPDHGGFKLIEWKPRPKR